MLNSPEPSAAATRIVKFQAPEIVFGPGALAESGFAAARLGARRPFVMTDPGIVEAGWVDELISHLKDVGLSPVVCSRVTPNPKDHEVAAAFEDYAEGDADVIVGIGGGSVMDAAKGVAILSGNGGDVLQYAGLDRVERPIPPMVMIPSTAGTGADVSQFCVVTDTVRLTKVTIMGRGLVPDISITDPRLLRTMPTWLAAASGLDALTHGIESYVSLAHNPLTDQHALNAVRLVGQNLERSLACPDDSTARQQMAQASLEAGMAFSNAILGATHAMSHQVGGLLDAPHGVVNAVLLPHVIRYNAAASAHRFGPLAEALGVPAGAPDAAEGLADRIRGLADRLGVPAGLGDLGVSASDLARMATTTLDDVCLTTNPRPADVDDLRALFRAAL